MCFSRSAVKSGCWFDHFSFMIGGFRCINYCNEKLQQLFIELVLKREQEEVGCADASLPVVWTATVLCAPVHVYA